MRLIDADELIKNIPNEEMISKYAVAHAPTIDKFEIAKEVLIEAIDNAETVGDVVKNIIDRPQGEWVRAMDGYDMHVKCTSCFKTYDWDTQAQYYNFCPNCGCRMKGADDE